MYALSKKKKATVEHLYLDPDTLRVYISVLIKGGILILRAASVAHTPNMFTVGVDHKKKKNY